MNGYRFRFGIIASLVVAVLFAVFVTLGFWQLHRAEEKRAVMALRELRNRQPNLRVTDAGWASDQNRYRRIELAGEFDSSHQFLLDNQVHNRQAGYLVLTPLRIKGFDGAVLVNRGWLPAGVDRGRLPELGMRRTEATITGIIDRFPAVGFKLKGAEIPSNGWPSVAQVLDHEIISQRLGYRVLPYQILLAADEPEGYLRDWKPVNLNPGRNQGYALQWFSFAVVLAILYVWHGVRAKWTKLPTPPGRH